MLDTVEIFLETKHDLACVNLLTMLARNNQIQMQPDATPPHPMHASPGEQKVQIHLVILSAKGANSMAPEHKCMISSALTTEQKAGNDQCH